MVVQKRASFFLPQWSRILLCVGDQEGIYASKMMSYVDVSAVTINRQVLKMVKLGLMTRRVDKRKNGGIQNIYLTDDGKKVYEALLIVRIAIQKIGDVA